MIIRMAVLGFLKTTEALRSKGASKEGLLKACDEKLQDEDLTPLERQEIEAKKRAIEAD